jgi:hypothetical protein
VKSVTPIERLMNAMDDCAIARGGAMYINGLRAGNPNDPKLLQEEMERWRVMDRAEARFRRVALRVLREARADGDA